MNEDNFIKEFLKNCHVCGEKLPSRPKRKYCSAACMGKSYSCKEDLILKEVQSKGVILIKHWVENHKTFISWKCLCGKESSATFSSFKNNKHKCELCTHERIPSSKRLLFTEIQNRITKTEYRLVSSEESYNNREIGKPSKVKLICKKGHIFDANINKISKDGYKRSCKKCSFENRCGENNANFIHGNFNKNASERQKNNRELTKWRKEVIKLHGSKCDLCDDGNVNAHHLNGFNWDIENRFNPQNGIPLCEKHHTDFHNQYGRGDNTKDQYENYKTIFITSPKGGEKLSEEVVIPHSTG